MWSTALVTGASSGIGEALARLLAQRRRDLVLVARRRQRLEALAAELRSRHGVDVELLVADLTVPEQLAEVEARVADVDRPVDLLVNNAGFGDGGRFWELDRDRQAALVDVHVTAPLRLTHAALGVMVPRGNGGVLNISSMTSFAPIATTATYGAAKAFLSSLTEALHEELRGTGVHMTALCPGFTRTEFQSADEQEALPDLVWMSAEDVARAGLESVTRNQAVCVPGAGYRVLAAGSRLLPHGAVRRITAEAAKRRR
jgi:uncharacterized protein